MAVNVKEINIPKFGWGALNSALEELVSVIKATAPNVEGPGVSLTSHGDGGIEISLSQTGTGGSSGGGDNQQQQPQGGGGASSTTPIGQTAGWQQINIVDQNCNQYTMYVWGGPPTLIL